MGHPKFSRPKYDTPSHPWKAQRIEEEHALKANHGLKRIGGMKEIWKAKSQLRRHRQQAMKLIGRVDTSEGHWMREKDSLLSSLFRKGLITSDAILDDILKLSVEDVLNRRLQAQVYYKGLASSLREARQLVVHGHICVGDQRVTIPSYAVNRDEEDMIQYHPRSPLNDENHIIRQTIEGMRSNAEYAAEEVDPEFAQSDAEVVAEAAGDAPAAEDTIPGDDA
ncbi:MAG: 30S ribosomal protein S4 [Candidatus Poseidoniaceae archaeon]|jgi:small subunit ribosomal protein S4